MSQVDADDSLTDVDKRAVHKNCAPRLPRVLCIGLFDTISVYPPLPPITII